MKRRVLLLASTKVVTHCSGSRLSQVQLHDFLTVGKKIILVIAHNTFTIVLHSLSKLDV